MMTYTKWIFCISGVSGKAIVTLYLKPSVAVAVLLSNACEKVIWRFLYLYE